MLGKLFFSALTILLGIIGASIATTQVNALDTTRDCDKYAVVNCGTMSTAEIRDKFNQKDHAKVFSAFGITKSDVSGDIRSGVVYRDGRVVVDGKTVATDAVMAARNLGGSSISGTNAKKLSVSHMGDNQTAFVKFDKNGRFEWAIMKPCGNPVSATPTKPKPKPAASCKVLTATPLSRTDYKLRASATTKNGATVSKYSFVVKDSSGTTVDSASVSSKSLSVSYTVRDLAPGTYTATVTVTTSEGNKTSSDCTATFTVEKENVPIKVCELATKNTITINEEEFDSTKHSRDFNDCKEKVPEKIKVCELSTKKIVTIKQSDFDSNLYSKDQSDCETKPVELPETGFGDIFTKLLGVLSLGGASAYYLTSKR